MTPADLAAVAARALDGATRAWSIAEFADILASNGAVLVADDHAFALGRVVLDEAELLLLATVPEHRRTGAGRACLNRFEAACNRHGAASVFLEVSATNEPACALYTAAGYEIVGKRSGYYQNARGCKETALVMRKPLAQADTA